MLCGFYGQRLIAYLTGVSLMFVNVNIFSHLFNSSYLKGNWQEQVGINRYNKQKTLSFVQYNRLK